MSNIVKRNEYPVTEWDPFRIMREMLRWDPMRGLMPRLEGGDLWMPQFEVRENGHSLRILADVPGVNRGDLEISVSGNRLVVAGSREIEERGKDENVHAWERQYGQFTRTFVLPEHADGEHITSELRDGVLTIVVPLKASTPTRKVPIGGVAPKS